MSEKRTGLGRGLDALLPGRQVSRQPSAVSHQQNQKQVPPSGRNDNSEDGPGSGRTGGVGASPSNGATVQAADGSASRHVGATEAGNGVVGMNGAGAVVADKDALAGAKLIAVDAIERNPYQTRGKVDEAALAELTASIREQGLLQPIIVREISHQPSAVSRQQGQSLSTAKDAGDAKGIVGSNPTLGNVPVNGAHSAFSGQATAGHPTSAIRYQLMAGERRWTAAQRAGLMMIPAIVMQASNEQAMEITIIENLQREDLNAMEQARAFERLSREFALTQEQIAVKTGKDRASVANFMRLLKLPAGVQQHIEAGTLSLGHGKVLMMLQNEPPEMVERVAAKAAESGTSVRELEELVLRLMGPPAATLKQNADRKDPNVVAAERELQSALGCKVKITDRMGKGKIVLEYATLEDFDRILEVLSAK